MTSVGNNYNYFPENQLTKFMYFPDRGCVRTLRTLYVYATAPVPHGKGDLGVRTLQLAAIPTIAYNYISHCYCVVA